MISIYKYLDNRLERVIIFISGIIVVLVSGCQSFAVTAETSQVDLTAETEVATPAQPDQLPVDTPTPTSTAISEDAPMTLTFWTVEHISPLAEAEASEFVQTSLRVFEQTNPDLKVSLLVKKATGKGGVLDFLRTAREVAPSVLPDVVIINAADLNQAYADNLIQPLDGRLDRSIVRDLLPAARRMGTVQDTLVGVPLGIELEHAVYNTRVFTATPILWTDILSKNTQYLFPAKGVNGLVNDATLSQYFSAGGQFLNDQGVLRIDEQVLRDVLTFYQQAREQGVINSDLLEASTTEELWPFYLQARAGIAHISVRQYLMDRESLVATEFAPVPIQNRTDTPVSMMHGWLLVLITDDIDRQDAALRLIESFLSPTNNATWNRINKSIPTRDTAYQQLAGDDPYWAFLTDQLNTARPEPRFAGYDRIGRIIQQAIEQIIRGEATAEEATATAIDALTQ
jgi:ABC-type glycerol-3-phosphate transport system substrate-binding protein